MRPTVCWSVCLSFYLLHLFTVGGFKSAVANGFTVAASNVSSTMEMVPVGKEEIVMMMNDSRRKLGSFQICSLCTCCGGGSGGKTYCLASPCCYAINCNIPNRPFGFCSFTPKTCNCFSCHV